MGCQGYRLSVYLKQQLRKVKGQVQAKRALEISAAGNHNLLMLWSIKFLKSEALKSFL
jgi:predicted ATPase with chaperone activity